MGTGAATLLRMQTMLVGSFEMFEQQRGLRGRSAWRRGGEWIALAQVLQYLPRLRLTGDQAEQFLQDAAGLRVAVCA